MKNAILVLLLIFIKSNLFAQMYLNRDTNLRIIENNNYFTSAFSGGINSGQFSEIDLNLDGTMDIIVFDKSGNKLIPYINHNGNFIYSPVYRNFFPSGIHDWLLTADYNCDGKNDIFTYSTGGMAIYKNTSLNSLSFQLVTPLVMSDYGSNNLNIYISPVDIPAISDIDYDGDLDILTFSILGGFVEYHKNMAIELTGSCDTVAFSFSENCWGLFYEGLNNYVLNCPNCQCPSFNSSNIENEEKHAGSTMLAIDIDNDNDKDLILGDISYNNLNVLINGGDNQNALIINVDSTFPKNYNNTVPANLDVFPASYFIDATNDGIKDLLVTTNTDNNSANFESCWLYENIGTNNIPDFNFIQSNFLQSNMIDLGKGAYPTFYDYNNDNLLDLIIGNYGYHNTNNNPTSSLALFENIGTNSMPKYNLNDRDWLNISNINLNTLLNIPALNLIPTFGDLDGDGEKDLIIGDADGKLHLFKNQGGGNFQINNPNYYNIDVGYFASPQIVDVNRDGLNDLIIGEQDGTINYCPNSGSVSLAVFDTLITNFGGIDVDSNIISSGYSTPKLIDSNGVYQLFVGSYSGKIYQYTNIDNNLNGQFISVNSTMSNIWDGGKCAFDLADITNDSLPELILGNISGGISYFTSDSIIIIPSWNCITNTCIDPGNGSGIYNTLSSCQNNCNINSTKSISDKFLSIIPNPNKGTFNITANLNKNQSYKISINNILGQIIFNEKIQTYNTSIYKKNIDISNFKEGVFILTIISKNTSYSKKIILQ